ncbi:MAG: Maf family protein [Anaeroplasmataceae bacterium]|nr:Maf family protein [Anaeroplasmataceae bacterium]
MKNIILRSASPRRKDLLKQAGYTFTIEPADIDETIDFNQPPFENVKKLGLMKAIEQQNKDYGNILIGCDTIVVLNQKIYGKPKSENDAFEMLKSLSGKMHEVMSGVGIVYKEKIYNFGVISKVYFKELSDQQIWDYIQTKECFGKAGSYAIQGIGKNLIEKYEGSLNNIIGLPIEEVSEVLKKIYEMED